MLKKKVKVLIFQKIENEIQILDDQVENAFGTIEFSADGQVVTLATNK